MVNHMKTLKSHNRLAVTGGFTLVELLVVIAIIAFLAGAMIGVGSHMRTAMLIKNTQSSLDILSTALELYQTYATERNMPAYPPSPNGYWLLGSQTGDQWDSGYMDDAIEATIIGNSVESRINNEALQSGRGELKDYGSNSKHLTAAEKALTQTNAPEKYLEARVSCELMVYALNQVPDVAGLLKRLPASIGTNVDGDGVKVDGVETDLIEYNDSWGHPLRYRTMGTGNVPVITSAGPDGEFDNADDILSTGM